MDHLPPSSYQYPHISVPYLKGPRFDNQGFDGFPQRQGYDIAKILRGDYSGYSVGEIEAFSQSWLFFALMSQVLDCPITEADFILEDGEGRQVLNSCSYLPLRDMRREKEQTWLFEKKDTWYYESNAAVKMATNYLAQLATNAHRHIVPMPLRPEIELPVSGTFGD